MDISSQTLSKRIFDPINNHPLNRLFIDLTGEFSYTLLMLVVEYF